ncbi:ribonuclease H2 subunit A [Ischnura elegans]|uniref:ribonuclease H2 subunit A n=1 Tax=Ischnura elegans TaxID=197161 RepID=UPI001ED8A20F|nr:ribonuclease H2 subunit A [Ischnura elegans]
MDPSVQHETSTPDDLLGVFRDNSNSVNQILKSPVPDICKEEPCILGVDEAGRGPVLGPMVYGICYCPISKAEDLANLGFKDSKALSEKQRDDLFSVVCANKDFVGWSVEVISPNVISNSMLRRCKYSLNQVSQDSAVGLIKLAAERGVLIKEVYVDTVGPAEKYEEKLSSIFPEYKVTVRSKADSLFPVVSAASICAKVIRDFALQAWIFKEGLSVKHEDWGSGYPNDPVTKSFLSNNVDPLFGFPQLVRFSWSTADKILQEEAVKVEWDEEEEEPKQASVLSFFKKDSNKEKTKHSFFKERNITSTVLF